MNDRMTAGEWLYQSLPQFYRERDAAEGYPLREFLSVLGEQGDVLLDAADRLYDSQYIETCDESLVEAIGALVGYRPMNEIGALSQRALVGRWISLMRSKGTVAALEEVARAATGWPARVVEYFQNLSHTQFANHPRLAVDGALDLRNMTRLETLGTAFDSAHYTVDVRLIEEGEGRHNVKNIGIFLWRLLADRWDRHRALRIGPRRYMVHPIGLNTQLFNPPVTESGVQALSTPLNLPVRLRRRFLQDNLLDYFGRAVRIWIDGNEVAAGDVHICNLADAEGGGWAHAPTHRVGLDPELGRIATPTEQPDPDKLEVLFHAAVFGPIGGGAYDRTSTFAVGLDSIDVVSSDDLQSTLNAADGGGAVEVVDSETYAGVTNIQAGFEERLELRALVGQRPTLKLDGDLEIFGATGSEVSLNGFLVAGGAIRVPATSENSLRRLTIRHTTLLPGIDADPDLTPLRPDLPSIVVEAENVILEIENSILGAIRCHESTVIRVSDSAIDSTSPSSIALCGLDGSTPAGRVYLERSTVIGRVNARVLELVSNSILHAEFVSEGGWTGPVQALNSQAGCARFSYLPPGSHAPRSYRCQPSLALREALFDRRGEIGTLSPAETASVVRQVFSRVRPVFAEARYGAPSYLCLLTSASDEIRAGADDEGEMGVWHSVHQAQRESNLWFRLSEFLPSGLEAGFFYET